MEVYGIKALTDCKTNNVVYVIKCTCTKCAIKYIRETENVLHIWMNDHWSNLKNRCLEKPIAKLLTPLATPKIIYNVAIFVIEKYMERSLFFIRLRKATGSGPSGHWPQRDSHLPPPILIHRPLHHVLPTGLFGHSAYLTWAIAFPFLE